MSVEVVKESGSGRLPVEFIGTIEEMRAYALDNTKIKVIGDLWSVENLMVNQVVSKFQWNGEAWNTYDQNVVITDGKTITAKESVFGDNIIGSRVAQITGNYYYGVTQDGNTITGDGTVTLKGNVGFENLLSLETGVTPGTFSRIEDKKSMRYIPGYELGAFLTTIFKSAPTGDGRAEIGITDLGSNGFFIGYKEVEGVQKFGFGRVKDNLETFIPIEDFNYDSLDGIGPSGIVIDLTKGNIWRIRFGYLGFASPVLEYVTPQNKIVLLHIIEYTNAFDETHVSSTSLSPYVFVDNGTVAENVELQIGSLCLYLVDGTNVSVNDRDFTLALNFTELGAAGYNRRPLIEFYNSGQFQGELMPSPKPHKIPAILKYLKMSLSGQNKSGIIELILVPDADVTPGTYLKPSPDSVLQYSTDSVVNTFANARVILTDTFLSTSSKIDPNLERLRLDLRPGFHAFFTLTSTTVLDIAVSFANGWAEEF